MPTVYSGDIKVNHAQIFLALKKNFLAFVLMHVLVNINVMSEEPGIAYGTLFLSELTYRWIFTINAGHIQNNS